MDGRAQAVVLPIRVHSFSPMSQSSSQLRMIVVLTVEDTVQLRGGLWIQTSWAQVLALPLRQMI